MKNDNNIQQIYKNKETRVLGGQLRQEGGHVEDGSNAVMSQESVKDGIWPCG